MDHHKISFRDVVTEMSSDGTPRSQIAEPTNPFLYAIPGVLYKLRNTRNVSLWSSPLQPVVSSITD